MIFFQRLAPSRIPAAHSKKDLLAIQHEIVLQHTLNILLLIYTIGLPIGLILYPQLFRSGISFPFIAAYFSLAAITIIRSISYSVRAIILILALQAAGGMLLLNYGLIGPGVLVLFGAAIVANFLLTPKVASLFSAVSIASVAFIGFLITTGRISPPPVEGMAKSVAASHWVISGLLLIIFILITTGPVFAVIRGLSAALRKQADLIQQLESEKPSLERLVEARSAELKIRSGQYEIASQIAREISAEIGLENILNSAVNLIRDRFGFYHVGIFLNDRKNEYTTLRAATGEAGRQMLDRGHRLRIGEVGMVGYVVSRGESRIALNVDSDAVHYKNPLLPETRSEVALPLRSGSQTIGALDVQSVIENAFKQEDIRILQIIADQVAIAFEKARLVEDLQHSIAELEASHSFLTQKAWISHLKNSRQKLAYRYKNAQLEPVSGQSVQNQAALESGNSVISIVNSPDAGGKPFTVFAVPVKLRNQVLGIVDIHFEGASISPGMMELVQGVVDRLAVSLENARLLEEIQVRAERERVVGDISAKVRAASDVDSVLRIAIQEIGQTLGVSQVMVQLRKDT